MVQKVQHGSTTNRFQALILDMSRHDKSQSYVGIYGSTSRLSYRRSKETVLPWGAMTEVPVGAHVFRDPRFHLLLDPLPNANRGVLTWWIRDGLQWKIP